MPTLPILTSPNDNATESTVVTFLWSQGLDSGEIQSPLESMLEISSDENFQTLVHSYIESNVTHDYTFDTVGQYYWRVSIIDLAGNKGPYTATRSLTIE